MTYSTMRRFWQSWRFQSWRPSPLQTQPPFSVILIRLVDREVPTIQSERRWIRGCFSKISFPGFRASVVFAVSSKHSAIHLWGRSGRAHCRFFSVKFREISANFPQKPRKLSVPFPDAIKFNFSKFLRIFRKLSRKKTFANDPISELLKHWNL